MHFLIAPDKFKGALTAEQAAEAIQKGLQKAWPDAQTTLSPMADGGEGTFELLTHYTQGEIIEAEVHDPLFRPVKAKFGLSGQQAFLEIAQASGLQLLKKEERNCMETSTFGTGELILAAIKAGAREIIIGIGGSATCDAGTGMANALGYRFLDKNDKELKPIGKNLTAIRKIDDSKLKINLDEVQIRVASDVKNPLYGPQGAAQVYGPQKGASDEEVKTLDEGLKNINELFQKQFQKDMAETAGAGAAGGLGAGLICFTHASLESGAELLMKFTEFEQKLQKADWLITGEGKLDQQSVSGKLIQQLTEKAKQFRVPVAALCGAVDLTEDQFAQSGLTFCTSILRKASSLDQALQSAAQDLEFAAFNLACLLKTQNP
jgi:glycerate 2-kinase